MTFSNGEGGAARNVIGPMNLVTTFCFEMMVRGDSLKLSGSGYSDDADTRELLEDALRGILAAMRIAAEEKPEVVTAIRKFKVASDRNAVTISGTLDAATIAPLRREGQARKGPGKEGQGISQGSGLDFLL
jgi:hypothetical protein